MRTARSKPAKTTSASARSKPKRALTASASGTRERILHAAIGEFAAKGYSGARIDAICRASRANPRMIYHYFKGKDGLYVAVLEQVLGELRDEELKLDFEQVEPLSGILQLFDFVHDHFGKHPELIQLLSGENLLGARFLRRSLKIPLVASPLIAHIARLLARGEAAGQFRTGVDPLQLYVLMVALCYFHRSNAHTLSSIFRQNIAAPDWVKQHRAQAEEMIERYLWRAPPARRKRH